MIRSTPCRGGALGGSPQPTPVSSPPPPSARRALRRPTRVTKGGLRAPQGRLLRHLYTATRAQAVDNSGGNGLEKPGSLPAENRQTGTPRFNQRRKSLLS